MTTALEGHPLAGYRPGKKPPTEDAFAGKVRAAGFSGFSHFTGEVIEPEPAPAPAPVTFTSGGIPGFSGFGHATGSMGGNPALVGAAFTNITNILGGRGQQQGNYSTECIFSSAWRAKGIDINAESCVNSHLELSILEKQKL